MMAIGLSPFVPMDVSACRGKVAAERTALKADSGPAVTEPAETAWIDVSVTVRHGMPHWPDNPPIVMQRVDGYRTRS